MENINNPVSLSVAKLKDKIAALNNQLEKGLLDQFHKSPAQFRSNPTTYMFGRGIPDKETTQILAHDEFSAGDIWDEGPPFTNNWTNTDDGPTDND